MEIGAAPVAVHNPGSESNEELDELAADLETLVIRTPRHWSAVYCGGLGLFSNLKELSICNCSLAELPAVVGNCSQLQRLCLVGNNLQTLPASCAGLTALRRLSLEHNPIEVFPEEILGMRRLEYLALSSTSISTIPEAIAALTHLGHLRLRETHVRQLPPSLFESPSLWLVYADWLQGWDDENLTTITLVATKHFADFIGRVEAAIVRKRSRQACRV